LRNPSKICFKEIFISLSEEEITQGRKTAGTIYKRSGKLKQQSKNTAKHCNLFSVENTVDSSELAGFFFS